MVSLVGRDEELRALEGALDAVDEGASRVVGVWGEPGIGKSRLLAELRGRAAGRGCLVLAGRATELERDVPFALWLDALERHVGADALAGMPEEQVADLAVALPAVGVAPAGVERHRVARAVRALLGRLAAARPVAVLLDDVHWADPASADVVALLVHRPPGRTLLALAAPAGRAPALEAALEAGVRRGEGRVVELGPLPRPAADALLPASLGPAARARLYRESGGNPFYLEALTQGRAPAVPASAAPGVPRSVMAALAGEVAGLDADARLLAEGAAVAGDPFDPATAAVAAGLGEAEALSALDVLLAADLVRAADQPRRFRFRHPLVRRAVYEGTGGGWRLAAHARVAEALAARGASQAERAHHVERAARPGDLAAVELLATAAAQIAAAAPATAAAWYEAALRLLAAVAGHERRRLELLRGRARALASTGRAVEARDVLRQVLDLLGADAAAERVEVVVALAELEAIWTQRPEVARRLLEAERAALGNEAAPRLRAELTLALAAERGEAGDHATAEALADEARHEARDDRVLEAAAAATAADAALCRARGDDPLALAAVDARVDEVEALVAALSDDQVAERLPVLVSLTVQRFVTGDVEAAHAAAERGLALARGTGHGMLAPAFLCARAFVAHEAGRLDAAEADVEEALESALLSGNVEVAYWASIEANWIALARGNVAAALEHGEKAWELLGTRPSSQAGFSVADARLAAGDPQAALAALEAFGWVAPQLWPLDRVKAAEVAVRVQLALGRVDEAAVWASRAPQEGGGRRYGVFGAILAHAEASVLLAQDAAPDAARVALAGAAAADDGPAPLWGARCRTLAGEALLASGRVADARRELRAAAAELETRGAWGYRDAAVRALRRLGDRPRTAPRAMQAPRDRDGRLGALTGREREVAELVAAGRTNAQIAARLHIREGTVEKHVSSALAKLGLASRAGIIALLAGARDRAD